MLLQRSIPGIKSLCRLPGGQRESSIIQSHITAPSASEDSSDMYAYVDMIKWRYFFPPTNVFSVYYMKCDLGIALCNRWMYCVMCYSYSLHWTKLPLHDKTRMMKRCATENWPTSFKLCYVGLLLCVYSNNQSENNASIVGWWVLLFPLILLICHF